MADKFTQLDISPKSISIRVEFEHLPPEDVLRTVVVEAVRRNAHVFLETWPIHINTPAILPADGKTAFVFEWKPKDVVTPAKQMPGKLRPVNGTETH